MQKEQQTVIQTDLYQVFLVTVVYYKRTVVGYNVLLKKVNFVIFICIFKDAVEKIGAKTLFFTVRSVTHWLFNVII